MKRKLLLFIFLFLAFLCFARDGFIYIEKESRIIGNDAYAFFEDEFTGVVGEYGANKIRYIYKEHLVEQDAFYIQKNLITNAQYNLFLNATGYKTTKEREYGSSKSFDLSDKTKQDFPVRNLSFVDVVAYCQWFSDQDKNYNYRLPTNTEWEIAAIDKNKSLYPWGVKNKILPSTKTNEKVSRYSYPVHKIKEDCSYKGVYNIMGGKEFTLDIYNEKFFENSPDRNPLCTFGEYVALCRGILDYNDLADNSIHSMGLFELGFAAFDSCQPRISFRLVKDTGTVFNKNTSQECIYKLNRAKTKSGKIRIYNLPDSENFSDIEPNPELYIMFETSDSKWYRVFYVIRTPSLEKNIDDWYTGWVKATDVVVTGKKWYEQ